MRYSEDDQPQDEPEDDPFVLACDTPGCLFQGMHRLSECFTAEEMEAMESQADL